MYLLLKLPSWWRGLPATWQFPDISRANLWNCVIVARPEYYFAMARNIFLSHTKIFPATKIQFAGLKQDYRVADPCKHTHTHWAHWADTKLSAKQGENNFAKSHQQLTPLVVTCTGRRSVSRGCRPRRVARSPWSGAAGSARHCGGRCTWGIIFIIK